MKLLNRLGALQRERGALTNETLRELARRENLPLYHLQALRSYYPVFREQPAPPLEVNVCRDAVCAMRGGAQLLDDLAQGVQAQAVQAQGVQAGQGAQAEVNAVSCLGRCDTAPAMLINHQPCQGRPGISLADLKPATLPLIPLREPGQWPTDPYDNPEGRYGTLRKLLASDALPAGDTLAVISDSKLRGMGGAGFPTGAKWSAAAGATSEEKYVICNADESEPGTFKDRVILSDLPHLVIEAMVIAGRLIGAREGVIFLRHEYDPERGILEAAIADARERGVLGDDVCGSGWAFNLEIFVSPGGYILGEESALLEALEDRRGEPRLKPPFPTEAGLWSRPTVINNVETLAAIPAILHHGAQWWLDQGRGEHPGWKFFAVSGDVERPGVYCQPMGVSAAELLRAAGGMADGKALQAFAPGGASSRFLPGDQADVALDFQSLADAGSMLGSGAVLYVAEGRDLAELAYYQARFFRNESCGKCVPCRLGTEQAERLVRNALAGEAPPELEKTLRELSATLARTSLCGLGQVALEPLLSVLDHFPDAARRLRSSAEGAPGLRGESGAGRHPRESAEEAGDE